MTKFITAVKDTVSPNILVTIAAAGALAILGAVALRGKKAEALPPIPAE